MEKIETREDLIDLGAATVETKGEANLPYSDSVQGQFQRIPGLAVD